LKQKQAYHKPNVATKPIGTASHAGEKERTKPLVQYHHLVSVYWYIFRTLSLGNGVSKFPNCNAWHTREL